MSQSITDRIAASRQYLHSFSQQYDYDVSYMDASPGAYLAFEDATAMGRYQKAAPTDLLFIAKIATARVEDCGPCLALGLKMSRQAGVPDSVIRGALHGGMGLSEEQLDVYHYAHAVAANEEMDPELLSKLQERHGREVMAELGLGIVATRLYPAMKRALGYAKSCSLMPEVFA